MILFAFAGNMDVAQFAKTVPSAKKIGVGKLPGYNFTFSKTSEDQSSKANVTKADDPNAVVWGVLIELDDSEKSNFFNADTRSSDFKLEPVTCLDANGNIYHAEIFTAQLHATNIHLLPYDWYHQKVITLAKNAGLPNEYIDHLSQFPFKTDPDEARRLKRMKKNDQ